MKGKIIALTISILLYSCGSKKIVKVEPNNNLELINNIDVFVNRIDKLLAESLDINEEIENFDETKMFVDISEIESYYKGDKVVKILLTQNLVNNFKELKEFYFDNDKLVYIKIKQSITLKDQEKKEFLRRLYFAKNETIQDLGTDNYDVSSSELLDLATLKLNEEYNKI